MKILLRPVFLIILVLLNVGCAPMERIQSMQHYTFDLQGENPMTPLDGRISVVVTDAECWIIFRDVITSDAPRAFTLAANDADGRKCATKWVMLESGGGLVAPAMKIGTIIRAHGFNTTLGKGAGRCASSCGLIFISGIKRVVPKVLIDSKVGFHQPSRRGSDGKMVCSNPESSESVLLLAFAKQMLKAEAAATFYKNVMETDCTSISYFGSKELIDAGIATGIEGANIF